MKTDCTILLASKSPRRRQLIEELDLPYKIIEADVEEIVPPELPVTEVAEYLAKLKSGIYIDLEDNQILLTADTVVILEDEVIGKPKDLQQAKEILAKLSGKEHQVITGVCLRSAKKTTSFSVNTKIHFLPITEEEIDYYVNHYQVLDKAGAYAIQEWIGRIGIESIQGDYYNVVGLPVSKIYQSLKEFS